MLYVLLCMLGNSKDFGLRISSVCRGPFYRLVKVETIKYLHINVIYKIWPYIFLIHTIHTKHFELKPFTKHI